MLPISFSNLSDRLARGALAEAPLHDKAGLVQRGMGRPRMVDAHQGTVIESHHEVARARDAADAVERQTAGQRDNED